VSLRDLLSSMSPLRRLLNPRADLSRLRHTAGMGGLAEASTLSLRRGGSAGTPAAVPPQPIGPVEVPERHIRLRHVLFNVPLLVGGLIVLALFIGVLFGPVLAPENPYLRGRRVLEYVDGTFHRPPFPPSPAHPLGTDELGRDTMSMLLYGTRNTLVAAAFITMARLALGLVLGGLAGWNEGRLVDRVVMGTIQMLISLPMLLVAMILILALDIRRGLPVFIIALCTIGWGEIAQYVRAEFIRIKQEPFLDSGRVIGLTPLGLAIRHVLPNILPALIVITLLEMGAALMILGELGFIGVYIGGGISIQVDDFTSRQYFSVPEWGAMMAGSRAWARSRPWMVLFPAIAFFVSVTGFNLLGEGLRRLIDRGVFNTAVLLSWRVLVAAALISAASVYVILTLGPAPSYQNLAQQLSEADLMRHVQFLSATDMNGRGVGSPEAYRAAEYIADELKSYGLDPPPGGWLQEAPVTLARLAEPPELALIDEEGGQITAFHRLADYAESIERHGGSGQAAAPVTLLVFPSSEGSTQRSPEEAYARFKGLDLGGRIAMVVGGNAPYNFDTEAMIRGTEGVLVVSNDMKPRNQVLSSDYLERPTLPVFRITPATADAILAGDGLDVEAILEEAARLEEAGSDGTGPSWTARELGARVRMHLVLEPPETVTLYNVLGMLSGADASLADELVVVSCHYDGWGRAPDGTLYPGANGNASGVATMLEIARLWQEQHFQPRRSVLFAAWAGGELPYSGAHYFRDRPGGFVSYYDIAAVIHLDRLGGANGDGLVVRQMGRRDNLFNLLVSSAARLDVDVAQGLAMRHHYQRVFSGEHGDQLGGRYGTLIATWGDPKPALADDTLGSIDPRHLSQAAQVINLTLITAAHEPRY
jgi:ABC-type dipeptide/oligopeptide/nickel transport system permease subunit